MTLLQDRFKVVHKACEGESRRFLPTLSDSAALTVKDQWGTRGKESSHTCKLIMTTRLWVPWRHETAMCRKRTEWKTGRRNSHPRPVLFVTQWPVSSRFFRASIELQVAPVPTWSLFSPEHTLSHCARYVHLHLLACGNELRRSNQHCDSLRLHSAVLV